MEVGQTPQLGEICFKVCKPFAFKMSTLSMRRVHLVSPIATDQGHLWWLCLGPNKKRRPLKPSEEARSLRMGWKYFEYLRIRLEEPGIGSALLLFKPCLPQLRASSCILVFLQRVNYFFHLSQLSWKACSHAPGGLSLVKCVALLQTVSLWTWAT